MVDHTLLLEKLELFGVCENTVRWFKSYLSQRSQSVCIDGCLSPAIAIECGVSQGHSYISYLQMIFLNLSMTMLSAAHHQYQPHLFQNVVALFAMLMTAHTAMVAKTLQLSQKPCQCSTRESQLIWQPINL